MTTTTTKGRITGQIALTMATDLALAEGDHVHVVGPYKVGLADGSKTCIGAVSVRSVKRVIDNTTSSFPVATTTGGQVTVEAYGYAVETRLSGAAINAGADIGIAADGSLKTMGAGAGLAKIGVALTTTTAAGQEIDLLVTGS
jgi:hypothetical protein